MTQRVKMTFVGLVLIIMLAFGWLIGSGAVHPLAGADPLPPTLHALHALMHPAGADPLPPTL